MKAKVLGFRVVEGPYFLTQDVFNAILVCSRLRTAASSQAVTVQTSVFTHVTVLESLYSMV